MNYVPFYSSFSFLFLFALRKIRIDAHNDYKVNKQTIETSADQVFIVSINTDIDEESFFLLRYRFYSFYKIGFLNIEDSTGEIRYDDNAFSLKRLPNCRDGMDSFVRKDTYTFFSLFLGDQSVISENPVSAIGISYTADSRSRDIERTYKRSKIETLAVMKLGGKSDSLKFLPGDIDALA